MRRTKLAPSMPTRSRDLYLLSFKYLNFCARSYPTAKTPGPDFPPSTGKSCRGRRTTGSTPRPFPFRHAGGPGEAEGENAAPGKSHRWDPMSASGLFKGFSSRTARGGHRAPPTIHLRGLRGRVIQVSRAARIQTASGTPPVGPDVSSGLFEKKFVANGPRGTSGPTGGARSARVTAGAGAGACGSAARRTRRRGSARAASPPPPTAPCRGRTGPES